MKGLTISTLGSIQMRNPTSKEIILIPSPTQNPNDPLNWYVIGKDRKRNRCLLTARRSQIRRYSIAILACLAIFLCTFLASGPSVALPQMAEDFLGHPGPKKAPNIAKAAYFLTTVTLMQGIGSLCWMSFIVKCGRRLVYPASFTLYTATAI